MGDYVRLYLKTNGNYALSNRLCELRKLSGEVAEKLREKTAEDMRKPCGLHHQQRQVINKHSRQSEDDEIGV
jgi:hypothetical protein